jgi:hypothetical protein
MRQAEMRKYWMYPTVQYILELQEANEQSNPQFVGGKSQLPVWQRGTEHEYPAVHQSFCSKLCLSAL